VVIGYVWASWIVATAIILAAAGLKRLGLPQRIRACCRRIQPAGRRAGAMAIEIAERTDGLDLMAILAPLNHLPTAQAVTAERKVSKVFGGSCQVPLAVATWNADRCTCAPWWPRRMASASPAPKCAAPADAEALGAQVAELLRGMPESILSSCLSEAAQAEADARSATRPCPTA
jgi:hydroxymethylbilane synthase